MKHKTNIMDTEVARLIEILSKLDPKSEEYEKAVKNLETLCSARSFKKPGLEMSHLLMAGTYIIELIMVLNHERFNVIATKAFGMLGRLRI